MQLNLSLNNTAYPKKTKVQLDAYIYIYIWWVQGRNPPRPGKSNYKPLGNKKVSLNLLDKKVYKYLKF